MWTAIVCIVAIATLSEMYKARLKTLRNQTDGSIDQVMNRLDQIEDRLGNLETIVLEKDRGRRFDEQLHRTS